MFADGELLVLADALPPLCCLVDALPPMLLGGWPAAVVVLFGGCFAIVSCFVLPHLWHLWRQFILCAGSTLRVVLVRVEVWSILMLLAVVRVIIVFSRLYVHFFSVSLLLVLCILVLAKLYLAASRLCL